MKRYLPVFAIFALLAAPSWAQDKPKSPAGTSATQVGENWIEVEYSRPILRGRSGIFGAGETYGETVYAGAPVWRTGANQSTIFRTDVDLMFGETTVPAGQYTLFVKLEEAGWTFILSNHKGKSNFRSEEEGIWGSYGYSEEKDVARLPMMMHEAPMSIDQLTIGFADVTAEGGSVVIMWDKTVASCPFTVVG